jgi:hypothetical protein
MQQRDLEMQWFSPPDASSCVLRRRHLPETPLQGIDKALAFLDGHLLRRATPSDMFMPLQRTLMLYGREGSGKTSLLHAPNDNGDMTFRYLSSSVFDRVYDYRLQHWNVDEFPEWAKRCMLTISQMSVVSESAPRSMLIVVGNLHKFNYVRGGSALNAMLHLLTAVRLFPSGRSLRLVLLCDESPGQFPGELSALVDARFHVAPPDSDARLSIFQDWIGRFKQFAEREHQCQTNVLAHLGWDLALDAESLEQDTHIIHTLVVASQGNTPREIVQFLQRSFLGCRTPNPSGDTVYCASWLESLLHKVDGAINCITPGNPVALNEAIYKYAGLHVDDNLIGAKPAFVRQAAVQLVDAVEECDDDDKEEEDEVPKRKKRQKTLLQPPNVREAIRLRAEAQKKQLEQAERMRKERLRDAERSGLAADTYHG